MGGGIGGGIGYVLSNRLKNPYVRKHPWMTGILFGMVGFCMGFDVKWLTNIKVGLYRSSYQNDI